jgi:hypothetical protein
MDWEIYDGLTHRGPMPEAEVCEIIRAGLPRNAYVRPRGSQAWVALETHPPFAAALQQRNAPSQWPPPAPPPPVPAYVGAQPVVPAVAAPPPGTPYAVSSPHAGKLARRRPVGGGCLLQGLGAVLMIGAGAAPYAGLTLAVPVVASIAGVGLALILGGGLLQLKWACSICGQRFAGRSEHVCPTCRASFD